MLLPDKHLFLTASSEMRELIAPLKKYGIHYFTYNKNYVDGTRIRLTTHDSHLKAFLENEYYKTGNIDAYPQLYLNQVALFSTLRNQSLVEWVKNDFDVDNGIYVVRKSELYTEFFCFATPVNHPGMMDFYLNNIDFLQKFCDYFKERGGSLLMRAEQNKLIHGYHEIEEVNAGILLPSLVYDEDRKLLNSAITTNLSPRLLEIAHLLIQGERTKNIARSLNISPRTVETHLSYLKEKLAAKNIIDLAAKLAVFLNKIT